MQSSTKPVGRGVVAGVVVRRVSPLVAGELLGIELGDQCPSIGAVEGDDPEADLAHPRDNALSSWSKASRAHGLRRRRANEARSRVSSATQRRDRLDHGFDTREREDEAIDVTADRSVPGAGVKITSLYAPVRVAPVRASGGYRCTLPFVPSVKEDRG